MLFVVPEEQLLIRDANFSRCLNFCFVKQLPETAFATRWPPNLRVETQRAKRIAFLRRVHGVHSVCKLFFSGYIYLQYLEIKQISIYISEESE